MTRFLSLMFGSLLPAVAALALPLPPGSDVVAVRAMQAAALLPPGASPLVAVLDTPFEIDHPALQPRLVEGYDALTGTHDVGISAGDLLLFTHGTAVASIISADTLAGLWPVSVFPAARIMPVKICCTTDGDGRSTNSLLLHQGILYAAGIPNDYGQAAAEPARVINVSYIFSDEFDSLLVDALTRTTRAGAVVVYALGEGEPKISPAIARIPGVVGVRAASATLNTPVLNQAMPIVPAPGSGFLALLPSGTPALPIPSMGNVDGSSFATAVTSAIVAMMRTANPALTPGDIAKILASPSVYDADGLDALLAVQQAKNTEASAPPAASSGGAIDSLTLAVLALLLLCGVIARRRKQLALN